MSRFVVGCCLPAALCVAVVSCGKPPVRSSERFCGELAAHAAAIRTLPTSVAEIASLIQLYSKIGEVAPLDVEADWSQLVVNLKTADTVNPADPASVQNVANTAYESEQAAIAVVNLGANELRR